MVRPRRAEQCLPEEGATPKRDAGAENAVPASPPLPDPRFAGPLVQRFGAPSLRYEPDKADRLQKPPSL